MSNNTPSQPSQHLKNFQGWHALKEKIHKSNQRMPGYKERDVWWVCMGHNIGVEEDGKGRHFERPVLIIRGFSRELFWGVPLSTTSKRTKFHYPFVMNGGTSVAMLSQARAFDTMRLINKVGMVNQKDFNGIKGSLTKLLGLKK